MEASTIRNTAWNSLVGNYWKAVLVAFLASIFGAMVITSPEVDITAIYDQSDVLSTWEEPLASLMPFITLFVAMTAVAGTGFAVAHLVLGGVVQLGYCDYLLKQQDRRECGVKDLFSKFDYFAQGFLQRLLRGIYIVLWSLLLIIPGIVKSYSYAMTPFIMAENPDMKANDAIRASMELMDGHKLDLWWLNLTFIGWDLLCLLTLGIGTIFLNPYKNAAHAAFYRSITTEKQAAAATEEPGTYFTVD